MASRFWRLARNPSENLRLRAPRSTFPVKLPDPLGVVGHRQAVLGLLSSNSICQMVGSVSRFRFPVHLCHFPVMDRSKAPLFWDDLHFRALFLGFLLMVAALLLVLGARWIPRSRIGHRPNRRA
jgi:hypothetical protein